MNAPPEHWKLSGESVPIKWKGGCPAIVACLPGERTELFIVDTGANSSSVQRPVFDELANSNQLVLSARQRSFTVGGEIENCSGVVDRIALGAYSHARIRLDRDPMSALGLPYLSRYTVRFDFPSNTMHVVKGKRFAERDSAATSGVAILQINGQKVVYAINPGGPAQKAGLQQGDVIERVDGRSAAAIDFFELREILTSGPGRRVEVEARRRDEVLTAAFELQRR